LARLADQPAAERAPSPEQKRVIERARQQAGGEPQALNEVESKELLRAYGIAAPEEALVASVAEALGAASRIGYPVVLKAVAATLTHKSESGAVALNLASPQELAAAYDRMAEALKAHALGGMLVCRQIRGGLELVLGLHRDPEAGLVAMVGSGGVNVELVRDVVFGVPPLTPAKARHMLGRTRAALLMDGYRGSLPLDREAVVAALVSLGHLAIDMADVIESVDVNPFVALPQGQGALALDALVVLGGAG
jgi:acyl-CoA synthetase (NDP forming)